MGKRAFDLCVSGALLVMLSPVFLLIGLWVKLGSAGPVFYRRRVMGLGGGQFDAFKFRSMVVDGDAVLSKFPDKAEELRRTGKLKDDPRITGVGRFLRKTSLDELPQLVNIFRGQMSLVGPRMIHPDELAQYGEHATELLTVRPGLTGLWQVSGRSGVGYEQRVQLDMRYIRSQSALLDAQILLKTIPAVLFGRGAY
ncbi:MAG TPA: sugar transferase [Thermoflexales bacterium]|nr:sugar transferase [Thermoflexales bacterium]